MTLPPPHPLWPNPPEFDPPTDPDTLDPALAYLAEGNIHVALIEPGDLAERAGIHWGFWPFPAPYQGIYLDRGGGRAPYIGLGSHLKRLPALARCVFYEELGHHFTYVNYDLPYWFNNQAERLVYNKMEKRALRWAALRLIPAAGLVAWIAAGGGTMYDLAYRFRVTPEIAAERIDLLRTYEPDRYRQLLLAQAGEESEP